MRADKFVKFGNADIEVGLAVLDLMGCRVYYSKDILYSC